MIVLPTLRLVILSGVRPSCQCAKFHNFVSPETDITDPHPVTVHRCPHREDRSRPWGIILQVTGNDTARQTVERALEGLLVEHHPSSTEPAEFLAARYDAGLAWVHFDPGFGGLGLAAGLQTLVTEALEAEGAPSPNANYVGVHQAAAAVHRFATDDLKRRWLRPAFTNEEFWCQLFSEPGAGSDLAGLSTSAVLDGEEWVVNGQKVWTSLAHVARWAILLARTNPELPKHRGLTFFVVDMHSDGVDVRPLRTIDGARPFNEVFLTDVRIPESHRLGDVGQGWGVSVFLLSTEREGITEHESLIPGLLEMWRRLRPDGPTASVYRDRVVSAYVANEVSRLLALRAKDAQGHEGPDAFAPVVKLARNEVDQEIADLLVDLHGSQGMLGGDYDWQERGDAPGEEMRYLRSRAFTIGGGTAQIMRNLIGERILGLPGEQRVDKGVPWAETRRSTKSNRR
jgi:alkylation response protein AidB-like acyl-CoA dehydrogenase